MYTIGGVCALPFIGPAIDTWGRGVGMLIGSASVVLGTVIMRTAINRSSVGQFEGGRFLVGWGVPIACAAGPMYVVEVSHPAYRGIVGAFYNTWWFTGSILASGVTRATHSLPGHQSWMTTLWFQIAFPGLVCLGALFLPESPRWLHVNGKSEQARAMLTRFHGEGNPDSVWVTFQMQEYEEYLELDGSDKRWWDYRALFKNKNTWNRLFCNCAIQAMGQEAGNSVLSYFQAAAFETAGITDEFTQHNLTLAALIFASSGQTNVAAGTATLAFQFIFGAVYSIGFTPLQALYPVEVLSFEMRAKGMAFGSLVMNVVSIFNNYIWPVVLKRIAWKSFIIFCIWCFCQAVITYFFIPETKNRTLEELDIIFDSDSPVKTSLEKRTVGVTARGDVVEYGDE